jgi:hypothetical protein
MKTPLFGLAILLLLAAGCKKNVETKVPRVTGVFEDRVELDNGGKIKLPAAGSKEATTFFIVRHGEITSGTEPGEIMQTLTKEGTIRAQTVAQLFSNVLVNAVLAPMTPFATEFGQPTADRQGTKVFNYNARDYGAFLDYTFVDQFGEKFVVIGYANSIPELLHTLTLGEQFPLIPEGQFDDLWVVISKKRGESVVHHLKY